jgi:hypothetical protein
MNILQEHLNLACRDLSRLVSRESLQIKRGSYLYGNPWTLVLRNEFGSERTLLKGGSAKELLHLIEIYSRGYRDAGRRI